MAFIKEKWVGATILVVLAIGVFFRLYAYGDLRLSIANPDTPSYIKSSRAPIFSWHSFAGQRLFTTNLIYKLANDEQRCKLIAFSMPAINREDKREIQPCFCWIAFLQNVLAVFSWCYLAWTTSRWLKNPFTRITLAALIMVFAFTPQIAEWESILGPESLTLTLYLLSFAVLQDIVFRISARNESINSRPIYILIITWVILYILWVFVRDAHLYTIPITILMIMTLLVNTRFRSAKILYIILFLLLGVFILGYKSAKDSLRATHYPVTNSFYFYIVPYPARMEFFHQRGMPDQSSPEFEGWLDEHLAGVFGMFLFSHPRFVAETIIEYKNYFESDFIQPYYKSPDYPLYNLLLLLGEFVHPETIAIYLIDILIVAGVCMAALQHREAVLTAWTWLAVWMLLCAMTTLFITFFGDVSGTRRHIFPSVEIIRLLFWIALALVIDRILEIRSGSTPRSPSPE